MIIYTVISRAQDAAVLVECADRELTGNAPQVTSMLLGHLRDHPEIMQEGELKTFVQRNQHGNNNGLDFVSYFFDSCSAALGEETYEDEHYFHLILKEGVYFCCIGDDPDLRDQKVYVFLCVQG